MRFVRTLILSLVVLSAGLTRPASAQTPAICPTETDSNAKPTYCISPDSARKLRLAAQTDHMRDSVLKARADRGAYQLAGMKVTAPGDDPNGHAFAYGMLSKGAVLSAIEDCQDGVQPKVWRVTCTQFLEAMNTYIAPKLNRKPFGNTFVDIYDYINGLEVRACTKGFTVGLTRLYHGKVDGNWSRQCKPGEVLLYDNQSNVAVMTLNCSNVFSKELSIATILNNTESQSVGPTVGDSRAGASSSGRSRGYYTQRWYTPTPRKVLGLGLILGLADAIACYGFDKACILVITQEQGGQKQNQGQSQ